ncbi:MAG: hypothetical protein U9N55_05095 [candidate division Zixibacteria bacterium]|nr:hypothetical protein [candidate division Zixibacteria bacterium]
MIKRAFFLGLFSIGGQVLLLRELISSLNGNELFIGTALFGWLIAVAFGAWLGGKSAFRVKPVYLFVAGAFVLPMMILLVRLSPLMVSSNIGEVIPFATASLLSIVAVAPVAFISGWLFTSISDEGRQPAISISKVYLFEGIGAFVGGVLITLLVGKWFSTLQASVAIGVISVVGILPYLYSTNTVKRISVLLLFAVFLVAVVTGASRVDRQIDQYKYNAFELVRVFDTPYSHQAILKRDKNLALVTDNMIEAAYPDLLTTENIIVPALSCSPDANNILLTGRAEFGLAELIAKIPRCTLTVINPRKEVTTVTHELMPISQQVNYIDSDPLTTVSQSNLRKTFDIIIIYIGSLDSYRTNRLATSEFLSQCKPLLDDSGLVCMVTQYDTDRYITTETRDIISSIYSTVQSVFLHTAVWPGNSTLMMASDVPLPNLDVDSIVARIDMTGYQPKYITRSLLRDRFEEFKLIRTNNAVQHGGMINTIERPVLPHLQATYRSRTRAVDSAVVSFLLHQPVWIVPSLLTLLLLVYALVKPKGNRSLGIFILFVAGLVSLAAELISFYVYQSSVGSLYSEMAALIGAFMLGLAVGTRLSLRVSNKQSAVLSLVSVSLVTLLATLLMFMFFHERIAKEALLLFNICYLFSVALTTGSLFVAATKMYYPWDSSANRGKGYAFELTGSAVGALFTLTVLLPLIGLQWLLISLIGLVVIALLGTLVLSHSG